VAAYDATNLLGNLGAGFLLEGWGRRRALVAGLLVAALSLVLYGLVTTPLQFTLVRALHGLAQALLSPGAFAMLSDAVPPRRRARAMGAAGVFIAVAAVAGPPLAGIGADRLGPGVVFLGVAGLLAVAAAFVAGLARDPARSPRTPAGMAWPVTLRWLVGRPALLAAYAGALAWTSGVGTLVVHLPLLLEQRGVAAGVRGGAFGAYALVALLVMAGPAPWLANRYGRLRPLAGGLVLIGVSLFGLAAATSTAGIYLGMAAFGLGFGLLFPAATALVADASAPHERSVAYGLFYAAYSLGVIVGEVGSGQLARLFGPATAAPFITFGVLALLVGPALLLSGRRAARAAPLARSVA
jgi:MFS family permease